MTLFIFFISLAESQAGRGRYLASISKKMRIKHARELLGKYYRKSVVSRGEKVLKTNKYLHNYIRKIIPKRYKSQSYLLANLIIKEGKRYRFDPFFIVAVIENESSFNLSAIGSSGEIGLMQIMPSTAKWLAKKFKMRWTSKKTLNNPIYNIRMGVAYLNYLRTKFDKHSRLYLSAYNMGSTNVKRNLRHKKWPKEYARRVMERYVGIYRHLPI